MILTDNKSSESTSGELQRISLATFIRDPYVYSKVASIVDRGFFNKYSYKLIFIGLNKYYTQYSKIPTRDELVIILRQEFNYELEIPISSVINDLDALYNSEQYDESFTLEQIQKFLKRSMTEKVLFSALKDKDPNSIELDKLADDIKDKIEEVEIPKRREYKLGDISRIKEVRDKAIGTQDNSKRIKSFLPGINSALAFSGFKPGDLIMMVSPPGCFTGDTKVRLSDNRSITIENLYKLQAKCNVCQLSDDLEMTRDSYQSVTLTKYVDKLISITINDQYIVRCTLDHPIMLNDGTYKPACELLTGSLLMLYSSSKTDVLEVTNLSVNLLSNPVPVYDIVNTRYHNFVVSLGDHLGIVVHNCGKTMYMINEGLHAAFDGFNVLHLFIGDMSDYDALIRYTANASNIDQDVLVDMPIKELTEAVSRANMATNLLNRVFVESFSADEVTIAELLTEVKRIQKEHDVHFDMILVDYADNLRQPYESTYASGGDIYNKLSAYANNNSTVIIVGSQPKQQYWSDEIIPKNSAADSSKKQHVVDVMLTFGLVEQGSNYGSINLAKVRRGTSGIILRIKTNYSKAKMDQISEADYIANRGSVLD